MHPDYLSETVARPALLGALYRTAPLVAVPGGGVYRGMAHVCREDVLPERGDDSLDRTFKVGGQVVEVVEPATGSDPTVPLSLRNTQSRSA